MNWYRPSPLLHLSAFPRDGGAPLTHPRQPHSPATVAKVRELVETTLLSQHEIAHRAGINKGTVSRWMEKHGWRRPPGAWTSSRNPDRRYHPVVQGRALAHRLRVQAERLIAEVEAMETVDRVALAAALDLLERARAEQRVRRTRRLEPPPAFWTTPASDRDATPKRRRRTGAPPKPHDRRAAAILGWRTRNARRRLKYGLAEGQAAGEP